MGTHRNIARGSKVGIATVGVAVLVVAGCAGPAPRSRGKSHNRPRDVRRSATRLLPILANRPSDEVLAFPIGGGLSLVPARISQVRRVLRGKSVVLNEFHPVKKSDASAQADGGRRLYEEAIANMRQEKTSYDIFASDAGETLFVTSKGKPFAAADLVNIVGDVRRKFAEAVGSEELAVFVETPARIRIAAHESRMEKAFFESVYQLRKRKKGHLDHLVPSVYVLKEDGSIEEIYMK